MGPFNRAGSSLPTLGAAFFLHIMLSWYLKITCRLFVNECFVTVRKDTVNLAWPLLTCVLA